MMRSPIGVFSVVLLSGVSGACFLPHKQVTAKLPMPSQPALTKPAPVLSLPPGIVPIATPAEEAPPPVAKTEETVPATVEAPPVEPKKPPVRRPRPVASLPAPVPAAAVAETAPAPEPVVPQLREILTPERRTQYENEFAQSVARAKAALAQVPRRKLDDPQRENVSRIETFLAQAEEAKKQDLGTALQLARRADLLGQDLLKSLLP
jgi:hypothetical protein